MNNIIVKPIIILLIVMSAYSCRSIKDIQKELTLVNMEKINPQTDTFNIENYNRNKGEFGIYKKIQEDSIITQNYSHYTQRYSQIIEKEKELTSQLSLYYSNGAIKERGRLYNNSTFRIGIWEYYDEEGNLTRTEDYDSKDAINWKRALEIVYQKYGYKPEDITLSDNDSYWMIQCTSGKHIGKGVDVDKKTGKTIAYTIQYTL